MTKDAKHKEKNSSSRGLLRALGGSRFVAPAAVTLLALVLHTWALSRNGMANSYYAAAVKSATLSWKAFFFGSLDPGSFITVDKLPLAIWVMAICGRIFGFSTWSMLIPQALAGAASVFVLHRLVRRWRGEAAAFVAALAFSVTPVAVLMFRYNHPDGLLTLLLLLSAWALWSALERRSTARVALAGALMGLAFLAKMLMGLIVAPVFVAVYLVCGQGRLRRRMVDLLAAALALLATAGWWVTVAELWPHGGRPHVGGTTGDSWIELIFSRSAGLLGTDGAGANLSGEPGWLRIFNDQLGGQVSWLLPLALVGLAAGSAAAIWRLKMGSGFSGTKSRLLAGYLLWGFWTLLMVAAFDAASGTLHSYYTVVLAPGVAALAGAGAVDMWELGRRRKSLAWLLPVAVAGNSVWAAVLVGRVRGYAPGLSQAIVITGMLGAATIFAALLLAPRGSRLARRAWQIALLAGCVVSAAALLAGPFAFSASTIARSVTGNMPAAGPVARGLVVGDRTQSPTSGADLGVDRGLIAYLEQNRGQAKYLVAVESTSQSVPIILATGRPVVTIGGYKSRDPYPTVAELKQMVAEGELRYAWLTSKSVGAGGATSSGRGQAYVGPFSGTSASRPILAAVIEWVKANGSVVDPTLYGGAAGGTLYYLGGKDGD